jgi:peptidyl-tRNA hydrolase, PTH1 family
VVGLGNPGPRYERTRHNAGFMAIDELAARTRAAGRLRGEAWVAEVMLAGQAALLVKPLSYMNRSGEPVARLLDEQASSPADLVVVVDDVALPLGRLRVRPQGSDGGHNGLRSLAAALGSEDFARVRIGVGIEPPPDVDLADFVLGEFLAEEAARAREVVALAADAVCCLLEAGVAAAMNRFNGPRD